MQITTNRYLQISHFNLHNLIDHTSELEPSVSFVVVGVNAAEGAAYNVLCPKWCLINRHINIKLCLVAKYVAEWKESNRLLFNNRFIFGQQIYKRATIMRIRTIVKTFYGFVEWNLDHFECLVVFFNDLMLHFELEFIAQIFSEQYSVYWPLVDYKPFVCTFILRTTFACMSSCTSCM